MNTETALSSSPWLSITVMSLKGFHLKKILPQVSELSPENDETHHSSPLILLPNLNQ